MQNCNNRLWCDLSVFSLKKGGGYHFSILELIDSGFMSPLRGAHTRSNYLRPGYRVLLILDGGGVFRGPGISEYCSQ